MRQSEGGVPSVLHGGHMGEIELDDIELRVGYCMEDMGEIELGVGYYQYCMEDIQVR